MMKNAPRVISASGDGLDGQIAYVLTDIDDTLTKGGRLMGEAYTALWDLHLAGFKVVPITGRPAGWCDLIAREWPVDGVIGENGALAFWIDENGHMQHLYHGNAVAPVPGGPMDRALSACLKQVPGSRIAKDQFTRIFDIAIDFAEEPPVLSLEDARIIKKICEEEGLHAKISSIHVNAWMGDYDKLSMAELFLGRRFGYDPVRDSASVFFIGDSPNDEPMFRHFPNACAVGNIRQYDGLISHYPSWITTSDYGAGFAEASRALLASRSRIAGS